VLLGFGAATMAWGNYLLPALIGARREARARIHAMLVDSSSSSPSRRALGMAKRSCTETMNLLACYHFCTVPSCRAAVRGAS
jgi:hypothetical protein